ERPLPAPARAVYRAREQLLSGAARALDEHARFGLGDQAGLVEDVFHPRTLRNEIPPPFLVAPALSGSGEFERLLDLVEEVLAVEGLGLESENAAPRRGHRVRYGAVSGEDDDGQGRSLLAYLVEQRQSVDPVHLEIGDHQVRARRGEQRESLLAALGLSYAVPSRGQAHSDELQDIRIVVNQKDRAHLGLACSRSIILRSTSLRASSCSLSCVARRCSRMRSASWTCSSPANCCIGPAGSLDTSGSSRPAALGSSLNAVPGTDSTKASLTRLYAPRSLEKIWDEAFNSRCCSSAPRPAPRWA